MVMAICGHGRDDVADDDGEDQDTQIAQGGPNIPFEIHTPDAHSLLSNQSLFLPAAMDQKRPAAHAIAQ